MTLMSSSWPLEPFTPNGHTFDIDKRGEFTAQQRGRSGIEAEARRWTPFFSL
jgi:hypothetical protein